LDILVSLLSDFLIPAFDLYRHQSIIDFLSTLSSINKFFSILDCPLSFIRDDYLIDSTTNFKKHKLDCGFMMHLCTLTQCPCSIL
jgi:hypothetical protein